MKLKKMLCVAWIPFAVTTGISDEDDNGDTAIPLVAV